jgi:DNA-binding response OmpR family regulator
VNQAGANSPIPTYLGLDVLVLEPDGRIAAEIVSALAEAAPEARVGVASSLGEAQQLVIEQKPALFVLDVDTSYDIAQEFIYDLRTSHPNARAIILTAIHFSAQRDQVAGLGAIHFLEKPFPQADFIVLVEALLTPASQRRGETFQGTLSDLHIADIIQLKCIGGATSMLEFTGPEGEKARVYFENGQVRHAMAGAKEGLAAFNEILDWKGGTISEVPVPNGTPHTIALNWQVLLMEAVRTIDESRKEEAGAARNGPPADEAVRTILVVDDSLMLLGFLREILEGEHYRVLTAPTASEGLAMARIARPNLILLDFVLPDMKGDEVCRALMADPGTARIPVVYISALTSNLKADRSEFPNIIGSLCKPFPPDMLIESVQGYLAREIAPNETESAAPTSAPAGAEPVWSPTRQGNSFGENGEARQAEPADPAAGCGLENTSPSVNEPAVKPAPRQDEAAHPSAVGYFSGQSSFFQIQWVDGGAVKTPEPVTEPAVAPPPRQDKAASPSPAGYFSGDTSFFPLHRALQTINRKELTGTFWAFWADESLELLARDGEIVLVTSRNPNLYCEEVPAALLNVEWARMEPARARQLQDGCPIFVTLADEGLMVRDLALDLVEEYGQKLFASLWTDSVRFVFEQQQLPAYARGFPAVKDSIDQWALTTLGLMNSQQLGTTERYDGSAVPAYTSNGYKRVQELRLTAAEAQFALQVNGSRSLAQIAKNLRVDISSTRVTLFRFLALEIVEC